MHTKIRLFRKKIIYFALYFVESPFFCHSAATKQELQTLEDIGEIRAQRIIEYRETYGDFSSTRELLKVSGIGEKIYEKIKDKITVD